MSHSRGSALSRLRGFIGDDAQEELDVLNEIRALSSGEVDACLKRDGIDPDEISLQITKVLAGAKELRNAKLMSEIRQLSAQEVERELSDGGIGTADIEDAVARMRAKARPAPKANVFQRVFMTLFGPLNGPRQPSPAYGFGMRCSISVCVLGVFVVTAYVPLSQNNTQASIEDSIKMMVLEQSIDAMAEEVSS